MRAPAEHGSPPLDLYAEAFTNGAAALSFTFAGSGDAAGVQYADSIKMTAYEFTLHSVELDGDGYPVVEDGKVIPAGKIERDGSLSTYVPFDGGGAPGLASTSPRRVTLTVATNAFTNAATLSMTRDGADGFKVWDLDFGGAATNRSRQETKLKGTDS